VAESTFCIGGAIKYTGQNLPGRIDWQSDGENMSETSFKKNEAMQ